MRSAVADCRATVRACSSAVRVRKNGVRFAMPGQRGAPAARARNFRRVRGKPPPDRRQWRHFRLAAGEPAAEASLFFDAHLSPTLVRAGDFDLAGMLAMLAAKKKEIGAAGPAEIEHDASNERITAGFERLDAMLGGGVFRGSSTLITGVPGTSKTTLAGRFAEAACRRGERALFVSFDEGAAQIARNLTSVGIQLGPHVKSGVLRMYSARTESISAEDHLLKLQSLIREHQPRCMVIDPLTSITRAGSLGAARTVANRLIYLVKDAGITLFVTALSESDRPEAEATDLQISANADTWIHLSYLARGGERNRALTIIKSRGSAHSNQVRELVLGKSGSDAQRRLQRRRRSVDGHAALGEGGRRKRQQNPVPRGI